MVFQVTGKLGQLLVHVIDLINVQAAGNAGSPATGALILETCSENAGDLGLEKDRNGHKLGRARLGVDDRGTG